MHGPRTPVTELAPSSRIAATPCSTTPALTPLHPACTAREDPFGLASATGAQSATRTASPPPGEVATRASAAPQRHRARPVPTERVPASPTTITALPCICSTKWTTQRSSDPVSTPVIGRIERLAAVRISPVAGPPTTASVHDRVDAGPERERGAPGQRRKDGTSNSSSPRSRSSSRGAAKMSSCAGSVPSTRLRASSRPVPSAWAPHPARPGLPPFEAGRDHRDPHFFTHGVVDHAAEDDVGVGMRDPVDDLRRLVDLEQAEIGTAGDVEQDPPRPFDGRLEEWAGDGRPGRVDRPALAGRRADPHDRGPRVAA